MQSVRIKTIKLTSLAILFALIVALQAALTFIWPGVVPITLALPLILLGAIVFGTWAGAFLGASFGFVVFLSGATSTAFVSSLVFQVSPLGLFLATVGRGAAAGIAGALVYKALRRKNEYLAVASAAVILPIVNTAIFLGVMVLFFQGVLLSPLWAENPPNTFFGLLSAWAGVNFVIELVLNVLLTAYIVRIKKVIEDREEI